MRSAFDRALVGLGAAAGLFGVALSAAAAHIPAGATLETAARFLLVHAPALIGLAAVTNSGLLAPRLGRAGGIAIVVGLVLFCGDLATRALTSVSLLPFVAPTGGIVLMAGWAVLIAAAVVGGEARG